MTPPRSVRDTVRPVWDIGFNSIVAIERDHLGAGFPASDDLERIGLNALDRGVRDRRGGFAAEAELRSAMTRENNLLRGLESQAN